MAMSPKLELRQSQTLTLTPQLVQAIKLLQLSNLELSEFVAHEIERNPLLERSGDLEGADTARPLDADASPDDLNPPDYTFDNTSPARANDADSADIVTADLAADTSPLTASLDSEREDAFPEDDHGPIRAAPASTYDTGAMRATAPVSDGAAASNLESYVSQEITLREHLAGQLGEIISDPADRLIALHLVDCLEDSGYLHGNMDNIASRLGATREKVEAVLKQLQQLDPPGVFSRSVAECLELQLRARDRYDPLIAKLLQNLDLLAKHDLAALKRVCGVDGEDLADMIEEIRTLNPKPGNAIGGAPAQLAVPDVFVRKSPDGAWLVELNSDTLPRVLVNHGYYHDVVKVAREKTDKTYLAACFENANWLVRSLEQRARTILLVASEIVRQQDAFLVHGVAHLKPMNLDAIAQAIDMHLSTISRVTSNKYMATPRGIFEMKYFFTSAIASADAQDAHSSEAVRHRIKILVDNENPKAILSDNDIVERLKADGIAIARRTVAKYRETLGLPSSVIRRREKKSITHTSIRCK